ncbi:GH1 family beta-glucosidase [Dactylosporangium sp. NPDC051485]|uniref:GH1 family beta-glucosidase n=1 Tax=Dactylosporangium sp. NPDC051485 TaxID=3154846 RepID=UPI0034208611
MSIIDPLTFPPGFTWGAATASYQIEGAVAEDGRTPSIWDTFSHTPGRTHNGDTGDEACDHYHRYREDVALMADLGLGAYRFSIAWPRVQPGGSGPMHQRGLDFYRRLVDELLERGITPWVTLYHWDLPQELEDVGGWPARDTAARFAEYAALVHGALGDRVRHWTTFNEPWCSAFLGYASGVHAPGRQHAPDALAAMHHLLLGHGEATRAIRAAGSAELQLGITLNLYAISPADPANPGDIEAARRIDGLANRIFLDPVLRGAYPDDVRRDLAGISDFGFVRDGDLRTISTPLDLLGINYYSRHVVAAPDPDVPAEPYWRAPTSWPGSEGVRFVKRPGVPVTDMDWEVDAPGLTETLVRVATDYPRVPLYVTENGAAYADSRGTDGAIDDADRVAYFDAHFRAARAAIAQGAPLEGYFAWSLLDNFEWAWGYSKRFGIIAVDYATQERTIKASGHRYRQVIERNGLAG